MPSFRAAGAREVRPRVGALLARPVERALTIAACAVLLDALLTLHLYLRPTPTGGAFALDPAHYVFHAIYYNAWAHSTLALPFVLWAWCCEKRRRSVGGWARGTQLALTFCMLVVAAFDRECQRFLGMHMTVHWVQTYGALHRTPDVIWDALRQDLGGPWSSLVGPLASVVFVPIATWASRRVRYPRALFQPRWAGACAVLLVVWPTALWNWIPGGRQRQVKVAPAPLLVWREAVRVRPEPLSAEQLHEFTRTYQEHWKSLDSTGQWTFVDPAYPLRRTFAGEAPAAPAVRPNFIVLSLETFRAKDMRSMNPELQGPGPTPFLDHLASLPTSAYYPRYYASAVPTVYAFMAIHASLLPHPTRGIHTDATTQHIEGFPLALRAHGYRTLHFTGSDPDWDSQRVWLNRWYDEVHFSPEDREQDRLTFRRAAWRLREVASEGAPFLAYISSISNHTPFRNPEPALDITPGATARQRLHNTMRYTDDVVRELYENLQYEPWFARTIWIITGDHGFDLGERGEVGGHDNLRHETLWVPLIVHGFDDRLPRGRQAVVASHLDLAPTITELAGIWAPNSYMGHSLLSARADTASALIVRGPHYAYETAELSLFKAEDAEARVYAGDDLEQRTELSSAPEQLLAYAGRLADAYRALVRYTVDEDRVAPRPEPALEPSVGNVVALESVQ